MTFETSAAATGRAARPAGSAPRRGPRFTVRRAWVADLDQLARFEVRIAEISFGEDAVTDPAVHRQRLHDALYQDPDGMFVAEDADGNLLGWLWFAAKTNFVTGERYANFRSFAMAPVSGRDAADRDKGGPGKGDPGKGDREIAEPGGADRDEIADALFAYGIRYAQAHGLAEIIGRVHVANQRMRILYRRHGFTPVYLTMRRRLDTPRDNG